MADKINRLFGGLSDDAMLEASETMFDLFNADKAAFTALDSNLNDAFSEAWMVAIDAARDFPTDESMADDISELTDVVSTKWDICKAHFQAAKYFIEKAFPGNTARQNKYGFDDYLKMSTSQKNVITFMDAYHDQAQADHVVLIAAGFTQVKIDEIAAITEDFRTANRAQELAKKDRIEQTQIRIGLMNDVWKMDQRVNRASKNVYVNNYAKLQQFLLPAPGSNEAGGNLSLTGTVTHSVTGAPLAGITVELPALALSTVTDDNGNYGFVAGAPAGATPITANGAGFTAFSGTVTLVTNSTVTLNVSLVPG